MREFREAASTPPLGKSLHPLAWNQRLDDTPQPQSGARIGHHPGRRPHFFKPRLPASWFRGLHLEQDQGGFLLDPWRAHVSWKKRLSKRKSWMGSTKPLMTCQPIEVAPGRVSSLQSAQTSTEAERSIHKALNATSEVNVASDYREIEAFAGTNVAVAHLSEMERDACPQLHVGQ
jgi:hypothetical protein